MAKRLLNTETKLSDDDELALLARVATRDKEAIAEFYALYRTSLFRFAFRLTRSYGAAEELVNDVMLAVWNGADGFRQGSKVSTWVFGIAYRQCVTYLRRKRIATVPDVAIEQLADETPDAVENGQWIERGLEDLPDEQRVSMLLVFFLGCSYSEVADITGCKEATVKTRMFHARGKLRKSLPALAQPTFEESRD